MKLLGGKKRKKFHLYNLIFYVILNVFAIYLPHLSQTDKRKLIRINNLKFFSDIFSVMYLHKLYFRIVFGEKLGLSINRNQSALEQMLTEIGTSIGAVRLANSQKYLWKNYLL